MAYQHYRSPFGDTTFTKVFVGGLAWETPTDVMRSYFDQFGDILEAVIITDKHTGKSKGYGFVTFRDPESARRACVESNPVIDGRRANCNIASMGRARPSPPRGSPQGGTLYQRGGVAAEGGPSAYTPPPPPPPPPALPPPPVIYPPYGYAAYPPEYGYNQTMYSPRGASQSPYYNQMYGASSASPGSPYYYGYSMQSPRGAYSAQRFQSPPYFYYPAHTQVEGASSAYPPPTSLQQPTRISLPSTVDATVSSQTSTEAETGAAASSA